MWLKTYQLSETVWKTGINSQLSHIITETAIRYRYAINATFLPALFYCSPSHCSNKINPYVAPLKALDSRVMFTPEWPRARGQWGFSATTDRCGKRAESTGALPSPVPSWPGPPLQVCWGDRKGRKAGPGGGLPYAVKGQPPIRTAACAVSSFTHKMGSCRK